MFYTLMLSILLVGLSRIRWGTSYIRISQSGTRMYLCVTRMLPVCYSYVTRMYPYVPVCYSFVPVWSCSQDQSNGVLLRRPTSCPLMIVAVKKTSTITTQSLFFNKNVLPAQAEYSYLSADFRLKIFLYQLYYS